MAIKPDSAESLVVVSTPHVTDMQIPSPERVRVQDTAQAMVDNGQDLDMPPTPDFGLSPKTPTTTNSMKFPQTPTSAKFESFASPSVKDSEVTFSPSYIREPRESEIDPTTIFVGGLEINGPNNWDENRVKEYFTKFGHVEDIKFIVPSMWIQLA